MPQVPYRESLVRDIPAFFVVDGRIECIINNIRRIVHPDSPVTFAQHGMYRFLHTDKNSGIMEHRSPTGKVEEILLSEGKVVYVSNGDWMEAGRIDPRFAFGLEDQYRLLHFILREYFKKLPESLQPEWDPFAFALDTRIRWAILLCIEKSPIPREYEYSILSKKVFARIKELNNIESSIGSGSD